MSFTLSVIYMYIQIDNYVLNKSMPVHTYHVYDCAKKHSHLLAGGSLFAFFCIFSSSSMFYALGLIEVLLMLLGQFLYFVAFFCQKSGKC